MSTEEAPLVSFVKELMRRRKRLPSQLAADLKVSHATVRRWLLGEDIPSVRSCKRLADYSGTPIQRILTITGQIPNVGTEANYDWPEFREYAEKKYSAILDEDIITMVEDLIERRIQKKSRKIMRSNRRFLNQ